MTELQIAKSLPLDGRLPIVVGVTGHRDLVPADFPRLESEVEARLKGLLETYPNTPLVVLTALAEGADQLAARVALRMRGNYERRLFVVAPLPYELEEYFDTFHDKSESARDELDRLLDDCDLVRGVLDPSGHERSAAPDGLSPEDEGFRRLGAFLVRNSHVLMALCEEGPSETALELGQASGGTVSVQSWFVHGPPERYDPGGSEIDVVDGLLLHWIPVRRDARVPAPEVPAWNYSTPEPGRDEPPPAMDREPFGRGGEVFRNFEGFNKALERERPLLGEAMRRSGRNLLGYGEDSPEPPESLAPLRDAYAAADIMTDRRFKPSVEAFGRVAVVAVISAVLAFEMYTHVIPGAYGFLALYVLIFLALPLLYRFLIRGRSLDEKRLVYRSLAESLRLQAYWHYAGVPRMVSHYYARHARNEIEWVRQAVRGLVSCSAPQPDDSRAWDRIRDVKQYWVADQATWFPRKIKGELEPREQRVHATSRVGLLVGFGIAIFLLARYYVTGKGAADHGHLDHTTHLLIAASIFAIGVAGVAQWINHTGAYGPLARRYRTQGELFARAQARLATIVARKAPGDLERARALLADLGVTTLQENVSWLLLYRNRPLEIHYH